MRTGSLVPVLFLSGFGAFAAHADIVIPEQQACRGRSVGDSCGAGKTCHLDGFSCQAGSCRAHDDRESCLKAGGCSWEPSITCRPGKARPVVIPDPLAASVDGPVTDPPADAGTAEPAPTPIVEATSPPTPEEVPPSADEPPPVVAEKTSGDCAQTAPSSLLVWAGLGLLIRRRRRR